MAAEEQVRQLVVEATRDLIGAAARILDPTRREELLKLGHRTLSSAAQVSGVERFLRHHPTCLVPVTALNPDPALLNTATGTLNIDTGRMKPPDPLDRITKVAGAGYNPDTGGGRWAQFIAETLPDPGVAEAVAQTFGGVGLPGRVADQLFPIVFGPTGTGKSTFINTVAAAFGEYAISAEPDLIMSRRDAHPTGQADLLGIRLAFVSESREGRQLDSALMKRLTGSDRIRARRMKQDFMEFAPSHLLALITNHLPVMPTGDDPAVWRRVRVVPFVSAPRTVDKHLGRHLQDELDVVLAWLVAGRRRYVTGGHEVPWPAQVVEATAVYRSDSDVLSAFMADTIVVTDTDYDLLKIGTLYRAWKGWLRDNEPEVGPGRLQQFAHRLREAGHVVVPDPADSRRNVVRGVQLKDSTP
jgi:putative DNA primase/helicase